MKIVLPTLHVRHSHQAVPLAAANLTAALVDRPGFECQLLDFFPDNPESEICSTILAAEPDLVAIPLYSWNRRTMLSVSRTLKQHNPDIFLMGGGPEATADPANARLISTSSRFFALPTRWPARFASTACWAKSSRSVFSPRVLPGASYSPSTMAAG